MRVLIGLTIFLLIFTGCSKKATVTTYSTVNIPIKNLQYVNLNIEGTSLFEQRVREQIPIVFQEKQILVEDPTSLDILHIIENRMQRFRDIEDFEETKQIKYVTKIYNSDTKKYDIKTTYVDRIYYTRCWIDRFELSASVTTRFKRDTIASDITRKNCRTSRYRIFHRPSIFYNETLLYNQLVTKLRDNIMRYLVPYKINYHIELEEKLDIKVSKKDNEEFKRILEQIDNKIVLPSMISKLEDFNNKYLSSYTIYFTLGVVYEVFEEYEKALENYKTALKIKATKKVLQRIQRVKANKHNLEKIKE